MFLFILKQLTDFWEELHELSILYRLNFELTGFQLLSFHFEFSSNRQLSFLFDYLFIWLFRFYLITRILIWTKHSRVTESFSYPCQSSFSCCELILQMIFSKSWFWCSGLLQRKVLLLKHAIEVWFTKLTSFFQNIHITYLLPDFDCFLLQVVILAFQRFLFFHFHHILFLHLTHQNFLLIHRLHQFTKQILTTSVFY